MARTVVRFNPLAELDALQRRLFGGEAAGGVVIPTTDVYTEGDRLVVEAHLPNFAQEDIDISVDAGALVLQAQRRERQEEADRRYVVRETSSSFYRSVPLPERADEDGVSASFEHGVLKVVVPFKQAQGGRKIPIGGGEPAAADAAGGDPDAGQQAAKEPEQPAS